MDYSNGLVITNLKFMPAAPSSQRVSVRIFIKSLKGSILPQSSDYVIRYSTSTKNGNRFYTDSNGLEVMERLYGTLSPLEDQNYYPITKFVYIEDPS